MGVSHLCLVLISFIGIVFASIEDCTFTFNDKTFDLKPLISPNGSYAWTQTLMPQDPTDILSGKSDSNPSPVTYNFEIQLCKNVVSQYASCSTPSPANLITKDGKNCTQLGDINLSTIEVAPAHDGVVIDYYHGAAATHIEHFQVRFYIICDPKIHGPSPPYAEHLKSFYQWHFRMDTDVVC